MIFNLFLCLVVDGWLVAAEDPNPTISIPQGVLQGTWKVSTKGRPFARFEGIPYAQPPIGEYRFREPQELEPWTGVWNATKTLHACLQYDPAQNKLYGNENCLYLNVYTPKPQSDAMLPVMVFIHGGTFMSGEGNIYGADNIMDWDMVVVTINFRLGPLGFLSTGNDVIPGNNGLKDQSFALHWVKNNIMMFGGNPDSITLTGASLGGASVYYHYLSPMSRDFHISETGRPFSRNKTTVSRFRLTWNASDVTPDTSANDF